MLRKIKRTSEFEFKLELKEDRFVDPPRPAQRQWLIDQVMEEVADELKHLDQVAQRFVSGNPQELAGYDIAAASLSEQEIMEDWQIPLMQAMADEVACEGMDVLEIGFGRGVAAGMIQAKGVRSHTIVEANPMVVDEYYTPWRARHSQADIRLVSGRWQEKTADLDMYDGIFFHAFPLNEAEVIEYVVHSVTFAAHAFPAMARHLRPGGAFTYMTAEIDSLSRRHQRLLFQHFRRLSFSTIPLKIPADTADAWWADRMVVVRAER